MEDSQIIELYFQRSEEAIRQTEAAYGSRLLSLADRILHHREDARECVNDTYLKAWDTIPPQHPRHLFAYLAKLCRFLCFGRLDWNNAQKRSADVVELSYEMALCIPDSRAHQTLEARELGQLLNRFLAQQSRESRCFFLRRYWFADSIQQIAARYGVSESKVKTQLFRTRNLLRQFLEKEGIRL